MKTRFDSSESFFRRLLEAIKSRKELFLCFLLFALVWSAFVPTLQNSFIILDDPAYVTENYHVQQGLTWPSIKWAFTGTAAGYWLPLTWLSHMLDCEMFGMESWGHHLTNIVLHEADTILLFLLLLKMTNALWRCFFVAVLFGVHPMHVESVAWAAERKDVLSAFFEMLALLAYVRFVEELKSPSGKSKLFYGLTLIFFVMGLMSKPMLVTMPFVLMLLDWWPLNRIRHSESGIQKFFTLLVEKIPFLILSAVFSIITFETQKNAGAVMSITRLPLGDRFENSVISYARYLGKLVWPENLSVYYSLPNHWPTKTLIVSTLLLLAISLFVFALRKHRYLTVGWLWFLGILIPVIGLVQSGGQAMADRFSYVSSIGIFVILVWGAPELLKFWRGSATALSTAIVVIVCICIPLTRRQIGYWVNGETLFRHALAVTGDSYINHLYLAIELTKEKKLDEAIQQLQIAIHLDPNEAKVYNNFGIALDKAGHTNEAIAAYKKALQLKSDYADAHANLGIALSRQGIVDEAIHQLQTASQLNPDAPDIYYNLGNAYIRGGRLEDGIAAYQQVIKLNPADVAAHNNLGIAYSRAGRLDKAIEQFFKAATLNPDDADTHNNLGTALYRKGLWDEAANEYQKALRLDPDNAQARQNLDKIIQNKK